MIDDIDVQILTILQENARTSNAEIARQVGKTASAVFERIKKLEKTGVVKGYTAVVDPAALECSVLAYVFLRLSPHRLARTVGAQLTEIAGIQEVIHMTGEECFLVKVRCKDTEALERIVMSINDIDTVSSTRTVIAFRAMRESLVIPVGG
ncbi:Lrp/AsnC family transcriptional regulator [Desulfovibrio ferrophilus]|uniref:Transcriptional regulator n=1 Tax=Desulfovibrio ferrophilus TaxID=241368 RepID=A0A2Z6B328_9BACT|nr:Lrp/AsnC family transcriptional regulator [Desulfovibrio ferrophilus]BBD09848.1 transcriptional regulator [Desulfovibrio ferrophilus]